MNAQTALAWSLSIAEICLILAMACAVFRLARGPRAQDRVVSLDALYLEVHPNPQEALSDSACMISISQLPQLLEQAKTIDSIVKRMLQ